MAIQHRRKMSVFHVDPPWDQRLASLLVKPLARTPVTPNQVTAFTIVLAVAGAVLIARGDAVWGAGLFVLARFLDHFDGELARLNGMKSKLGYYLDYVAGATSYSALFLGMGIGFADGWLGHWAYVLGISGALASVISLFLNLDIDKHVEGEDGDAIGYPGFAGFELEDGVYLLAPVAWLGFLEPFLVAAGIGAGVYTLYTLITALRLRRGGAAPAQE